MNEQERQDLLEQVKTQLAREQFQVRKLLRTAAENEKVHRNPLALETLGVQLRTHAMKIKNLHIAKIALKEA